MAEVRMVGMQGKRGKGYRVQVCRVHGDEEGNNAEGSDTDGRDAERTNAVGVDGRVSERRVKGRM